MYFSTVPASMLTPVLSGTLLDSISTVIYTIAKEDFLSAIVFCFVILVTAVTIMNMLIGVICEVMGNVATVERETLTKQFLKREITGILGENDRDSNGLICRE